MMVIFPIGLTCLFFIVNFVYRNKIDKVLHLSQVNWKNVNLVIGTLVQQIVSVCCLISFLIQSKVKVKVGVLRPVQQPGSYWDRSSELPLVGLEPTEVTAYD